MVRLTPKTLDKTSLVGLGQGLFGSSPTCARKLGEPHEPVLCRHTLTEKGYDARHIYISPRPLIIVDKSARLSVL